MAKGITVIFGEVRTQQSGPTRASELSGPPAGGWESACAAPPKPRDAPAEARRELIHESHHAGRNFERRVQTFRVG